MKTSTFNILIIGGISVIVAGSIFLIVRGFKNKFIDSYSKKTGEYVGSGATEYDKNYFRMFNTSGQEIFALKDDVNVSSTGVATAKRDMTVKILKTK